MQRVAEDRLLLRAARAEGGVRHRPFARRAGRVVELDDRHRQTLDHTRRIVGYIQGGQRSPPQLVESLGQRPPSPIEPRPLRLAREQIAMRLPLAEPLGLAVPATALADQRHRQQLGIATDSGGARTNGRARIGRGLGVQVADYPRIGLIPPVASEPGVDAVNVTRGARTTFTWSTFVGHSYYIEVPAVIEDIAHVLNHSHTPKQRHLDQRIFWEFPTP